MLTVTPGWSESYGLFTKGEAPMVLSYTTSPAYHAIEEGSDRYRALSFPEGHYLQIELAGMIEDSDRPKLARDFLAFVVSPQFQDIIPTTNWMLPAAKTSKPLPGAFEALVEPTKTFLFSPEEVAQNRRAWIDEWLGGDEPLTGLNQRAKVAAGAVVLALLVAVVLGAASALVWAGAGDLSGLVPDAYLARIAAFTLLQATLSTLLSLALGVLLARSLARQTAFVGRNLLVRLLALPLALPAIVAVLGVVAVWGGRGWVNGALTALDMGRLPSIYGLGGILLAHVFFNLPLAARLMLGHFERVPAEHWRLAAQLALPPATSFRLIEWPVVRRNAPGVAGLVFMLCLTSFAVVLTLGGGPGATTLEVAIYQALRFDFDPTRAVVLAAAQLALTAGLLGLAALFGADLREEPGLGRPIARYDRTGTARALDFALIALAAAFVALPMLAVVVDGLGADLARLVREAAVQQALLTSLAIGASAAVFGVAMAVALIAAARATTSLSLKRACGAASSLTLVVPPVLLGCWLVRPAQTRCRRVRARPRHDRHRQRDDGPAVRRSGARPRDRQRGQPHRPAGGALGHRRARLGPADRLAAPAPAAHDGARLRRGPVARRSRRHRAPRQRPGHDPALPPFAAHGQLPHGGRGRHRPHPRRLDARGVRLLRHAPGAVRVSGAPVRLEGVRFAYGGTAFVLDITVDAGAVAAIIGPSGAGKSTLLNLIAGFETPQAGRVLIDGRDVGGLLPAARPVSMVFQDNNLFAHLDVATNVALGINPSGRPTAAQKRAVADALARLGLAGMAGRYPGELSGGERGRVALARATLRDRPVLLLDEPFAALGPALRADMLDLLRAPARDPWHDRLDRHPPARRRPRTRHPHRLRRGRSGQGVRGNGGAVRGKRRARTGGLSRAVR